MNSTRWFALASAFAGCAVAYGIHLFAGQDPARPTGGPLVKAKALSCERGASFSKSPGSFLNDHRTRSAARGNGGQDAVAATTPRNQTEARAVGGAPVVSNGKVLSESRWHANAARVEQEANHELARLSGLLDLDPAQQDRIFTTLARQSPYWLPGMQAGGNASADRKAASDHPAPGSDTSTPAPHATANSGNAGTGVPSSGSTASTGSAADGTMVAVGTEVPASVDLTADLTADQELALVQDEMDRQAWWAEMLPQLLPPTLQDSGNDGIAASPSPDDEAEAPPDTKSFDGEELLEE